MHFFIFLIVHYKELNWINAQRFKFDSITWSRQDQVPWNLSQVDT